MRIRKSSIITLGIALSICIAGTGCQLEQGGKWYNPTAWKMKHKKDGYDSSYAYEDDDIRSPRSTTTPEIHSPNGGYSGGQNLVANNPQGNTGGYTGDTRSYVNPTGNQGGFGPAPSPNVPVSYQNPDQRYQTNNDPRYNTQQNQGYTNAPQNQGQYQTQPNNNIQQRDQYYTDSYGQYSGTGNTNNNTAQNQYSGYENQSQNSYNTNGTGAYNNSYNNTQPSNNYGPGSTDPSYNYNYSGDNYYNR